MAKSKLTYAVRETIAPGETTSTFVPVIVDRLQPVELQEVIENCIDRNLILAAKATAAKGIAEGIAAQIYKEFTKGNGVAFGNYFYGRLYLNGTVGTNGTLTNDNKVNVRLMKGDAFKLTLSDFSMSFSGSATAPKLEFVQNFGEGGNNTRGEVVNGAKVAVYGENLFAAGDTDEVTFTEVGASTPAATVTAFDSISAVQLTFSCPALEAGKVYEVAVKRTDPNGVTRKTGTRKVTASGSAAPTGPVLTGVHAPGIESPMIRVESSIWFDGTGLDGWTEGRDSIWCKNNRAEEAEFVRMDGDGSGAMVEFDGGMLKADEGAWSVLTDLGIVEGSEVRFKVTINGQSAEIVGTVGED